MDQRAWRPIGRAACAALLLLALAPQPGAAPPISGDDATVLVDPAATRVMLASVRLTLSELRPEGADLVGHFEIDVPLLPSSADRGTVRIRAPGDWRALSHGDLELVGSARSESGQVNPVRCTARPDGSLRIRIDTPRRTLSFATRYRLLRSGS